LKALLLVFPINYVLALSPYKKERERESERERERERERAAKKEKAEWS
jgi:hypothetical protein